MEVHVQKQEAGSLGGYPRVGEGCREHVLWTDRLTHIPSPTLLPQVKGDTTPSAETQPASASSTEVR